MDKLKISTKITKQITNCSDPRRTLDVCHIWTKLLVKFSDRASVQSTKCSTTGACACSTESLHNLVLVLLSSYFRNIRQRLEYFHLLKRQIIFLQVSFQFDVRRLVAQTISST